ncbi:MAG: M64 family metallopeptidase [Dysgonomonas sp.]|nr:M64 family metallopeptidase [Dysgonomonas sp.]
MKKLLLFFCLILPIISFAQDFDTYFEDKTLRIDYIFGGNADRQFVLLDQLVELPQWAGRRHNLSKSYLDGNGQIMMYDLKTESCIYKNTFSSLFQEWLTTPEAKSVSKSFENTYLLPFPKEKVRIEITFRNRKGEYDRMLTHEVDPKDILIHKKGYKSITPYNVQHRGGEVGKSINVAILAEGFTKEEMPLFRKYAKESVNQIFIHAPFDKYRDSFNFYVVESISEDSGVSVPRDKEWKNTAFHSHFDTFYSDRYLTTSRVKDVHDALAGIPYEHIIILANTDVYGGGGILNAYTLTTTGHPNFKPVVVHEFGHSFAGLADEYFYENDTFDDTYPLDVEPWEHNVTTLVDFNAKWKDMISPRVPIPTNLADSSKYKTGVYEGAAYSFKGIYRGSVDCRMKTNTYKDFCPVCQRAIERLILFYTKDY